MKKPMLMVVALVLLAPGVASAGADSDTLDPAVNACIDHPSPRGSWAADSTYRPNYFTTPCQAVFQLWDDRKNKIDMDVIKRALSGSKAGGPLKSLTIPPTFQ